MDIEKFDDGASVELFSRESLAYRENGCMVQVEYDYFKAGIFKTGRKILCDSISQWEEFPSGVSPTISQDTKQRIIERAKEYFDKRNLPVELVA